MANIKKYMAESMGTAVLVILGCWSAVLAGNSIGFTGISFAFGLAVVAMAYSIGHISGCHINPAISVGMWVSWQMKWKSVLFYIIAQCIGATIGAWILYIIVTWNGWATANLWQNWYGTASPNGYNALSAFVTELVMTFIFVRVVLGATSPRAANPWMAGLAIGLTLVVIHLVSIPVTGTSVNPARSLGPAVWVGGLALSQLWLFWVAPLLWAVWAWISFRVCENKK